MTRDDLLKVLASLLVLGMEWWIMQPVTPPLAASGWLALARASGAVARTSGRLSLYAEYNYYACQGGGA